MKKIITSILSLAVLVGCSKIDEQVVNNADNITFGISAAMPDTRTELVNTNGKYGAIWKAGDTFSIIEVGDGSNKQNGTTEPLAEDAATISAKVTVKANSYSKYEYFFAAPKASMNGACTYMAMTLPADQAPLAMGTFDGAADFLIGKPLQMAAQPLETDVLKFDISRMSSIGKVTVKGMTLDADDKVTAVKITFEQLISGKITKIMTDNLRAGTYPQPFDFDASATKYVAVTLPQPQTGEFTYYMCCWPQIIPTGSTYTVELTTEKGATITKSAAIPSDLTFSAGDITSFTVHFAAADNEPTPGPDPEPEPGVDPDPVPTTGTVTVAGVEWAIGNLQFVNGGTGAEGFAAGWSISAGQHYHHYLGQIGNIDITDLTSMAHFNFGGIENPCINDATMCASIAGSKDISGKMYTDQTCVNETTDYSAAKFGDIAYWASKGKYRMPTGEEMQKLYTDACRTKASYTTAEGVEVLGTYYYDPAAGETPGAIEADTPRVLKNADMKKGLFLPYTGRFYSTGLTKLYGINAQGVYRSATTISASTLEQTYGAIYRPHTLAEKDGKYPEDFIYTYWEAKNQGAYGAISLYSIRPVKVK